MAVSYTYIPLDTSTECTRVLILYPSHNLYAPLIGQLIVCSLDDDIQRFEAISYAWEGQTPSSEYLFTCVDFEGFQEAISLTKNCSEALRYMRLPDRCRGLWIDCVCIDQSNENEKSHQVGIMSWIYSKAGRVTIWLGPDITDNVLLTFQLLETCSQAAKAKKTGNPDDDGSPDTDISEPVTAHWLQRIRTISNTITNIGDEAVLHDVFYRSWFKRMWTLQEVGFRRPAVRLQCERSILHSRDLQHAIDWLGKVSLAQQKILLDAWAPIMRLQFCFFELLQGEFHPQRRERNPESWMKTLCDTIDYRGSRQASDPRDMIFSLHGMLRRLGFRLDFPDYSLDVCSVYSKATKAVIEYDDSLAVLKKAQKPEQQYSLPSWVPDWSQRPSRSQGHIGVGKFDPKVPPRSKAIYSFEDDGRALLLMGIIIDELSVVGGQMQSGESKMAEIEQERDISRPLKSFPESFELGFWHNFQQWISIFHEPNGPVYHSCNFATTSADIHSVRVLTTSPFFNALSTIAKDLIHDKFSRFSDFDFEKALKDMQFLFEHAFVTSAQALAKDVIAFASRFMDEDEMNQIDISKMDVKEIAKGLDRMLFSAIQEDDEPDPNGLPQVWELFVILFEDLDFFRTQKGYMGIIPYSVWEADVLVQVSGMDEVLVVRPAGDGYQLLGFAYVPGLMKGEKWPATSHELQFIKLV